LMPLRVVVWIVDRSRVAPAATSAMISNLEESH
jgi:hypothetical protein